jgi:heptaprenyl diphosphate synthase
MRGAPDVAGLVEIDLRTDLERVEAALQRAVDSSQPLVRQAARHLLAAGGKRFRPMLALLCARLGEPSDPRVIPCAVALELTHVATLYHDDVIDEATLRRGAPSANARFDNTVAVLAGDYLFARASGIAAELGPYVSRMLADTIAEVCEGQIMECEGAGSDRQSLERYLVVVERKTAALLATSCHLGAWLAGAPEAAVRAVTAFGRAFGVAFQLSDDVLDVTAREEESGKRPGTDLREGVWTLPVLLTLEGRAPGEEELRSALAAGDVEAALAVLRANGSCDLALAEAAAWAGRAKRALGPVPAGPVRTALERLADFLPRRGA